jgi:hypothetical protein
MSMCLCSHIHLQHGYVTVWLALMTCTVVVVVTGGVHHWWHQWSAWSGQASRSLASAVRLWVATRPCVHLGCLQSTLQLPTLCNRTDVHFVAAASPPGCAAAAGCIHNNNNNNYSLSSKGFCPTVVVVSPVVKAYVCAMSTFPHAMELPARLDCAVTVYVTPPVLNGL